MNATLESGPWMRYGPFCAIFSAFLLCAGSAAAQGDSEDAAPRSESSRAAATLAFLGGAGAGFLAHEGGHLLFDVAFDAGPGLRRVEFAGIPFFAIAHRDGLPPAREYTISAAGFWAQNALAEWVLTRSPRVRRERAAFRKGVLSWSVASAGAYTIAALGGFGPPERDTRGMADALDVPEPLVGAMLIVPAVCDLWRYLDPDARWPRWISRGAKVGLVLVVFRARR